MSNCCIVEVNDTQRRMSTLCIYSALISGANGYIQKKTQYNKLQTIYKRIHKKLRRVKMWYSQTKFEYLSAY